MRVRTSLLMALATAPLLAGCGSIFGGHHPGASAEQWMKYASEPEGYAAAQLAEGRQALQDSQYGQAIIAFRNAQRFPETAAAAANGLGVAYAQIGRPDVAEHYFELAVSQAPDDRRFSTNLDRLRFQLAAQQTVVAIRPALAAETPAGFMAERLVAAFPGTVARAGIRVEQPTAKMARVSDSEVQLATADGEKADLRRRAPAARPTVGIVATATQPDRRRNPNYPIRVELTPSAMADAGDKQRYPVRIGF